MAAPPGNQNALKSKLVHDELRKLAVQDDFRSLRAGLGKVMSAFEAGEPWAAQFVRDTLDGRPSQSVTMTEEEAPMFTSIRMVIVNAESEPMKVIEHESNLTAIGKN
jgi:hypothetical protein